MPRRPVRSAAASPGPAAPRCRLRRSPAATSTRASSATRAPAATGSTSWCSCRRAPTRCSPRDRLPAGLAQPNIVVVVGQTATVNFAMDAAGRHAARRAGRRRARIPPIDVTDASVAQSVSQQRDRDPAVARPRLHRLHQHFRAGRSQPGADDGRAVLHRRACARRRPTCRSTASTPTTPSSARTAAARASRSCSRWSRSASSRSSPTASTSSTATTPAAW